MKKILKELSELGGISGFENTSFSKINNILKKYTEKSYTDNLCNLIGIIKSKKENAKKIMLVAHMDVIGLMVSDILDGGFLSFVPIGGVDPKCLLGADVTVFGKKEIAGVIGAKPPHLQTAEESGKIAQISDMAIDTGYTKEELLKIVSVGDEVTFFCGADELLGDMISSKYLDDRAGIVSLLIAAEKIREKNVDADVYILLSSQEEVGTRGAATAAWEINPNAAIVVDVTHGKTPDSDEERSFKTGSGAAICTGPNIHPYLFELAKKTAEKHKIPYEIEVEGGGTGTDAEAVQIANNGIPTALFSIPLRYMHTMVETLDFNDVIAVGSLIAEMTEALSKENAV